MKYYDPILQQLLKIKNFEALRKSNIICIMMCVLYLLWGMSFNGSAIFLLSWIVVEEELAACIAEKLLQVAEKVAASGFHKKNGL